MSIADIGFPAYTPACNGKRINRGCPIVEKEGAHSNRVLCG